MNHTWNIFKAKLQALTMEEKQELLKQLHTDLMYFKTRRFQEHNSMKIKLLKRQIAYVKTVMKLKGFSYYPR